MKDIQNWLPSLHPIIEFLLVAYAAFIASSSFRNFFSRRKADEHISKLLKSEKNYFDVKFKELNEQKEKEISQLLTIPIDKEYDLKAIEIRSKLLDQGLEMLKLEILKQKLLILANQLNEKERNDVLEAIGQPTTIGQINYLNNVLRQSGATENIIIKYVK
jgi:hypothetical protein